MTSAHKYLKVVAKYYAKNDSYDDTKKIVAGKMRHTLEQIALLQEMQTNWETLLQEQASSSHPPRITLKVGEDSEVEDVLGLLDSLISAAETKLEQYNKDYIDLVRLTENAALLLNAVSTK